MNVDDQALYRHIGKQVRTRRHAVHLTQEQLASRLGLSRTSITNVETGLQKLPLHLLYRLCAILELEIATLLPKVSAVVHHQDVAVTTDRQDLQMAPKTATLVRQLLGEDSDQP